MAEFFPRQTVVWKATDEPFLRRVGVSIVAMALLAGVLAKGTDWLLRTYAPVSLWWFLLGEALPWVVRLVVATAHLGNYTIRRWTYRAPLFGALEGAAELLLSAALVSLGRERLGTGLMGWDEWRLEVIPTLVWRVVVVSGFALILAGVVQVIRFLLIRRERRESTLIAVHEEHVRHSAEHHAEHQAPGA